MEKLVFQVWKSDCLKSNEFRDVLIRDLAPEIMAAGARQLSIAVDDDAVERGAGRRYVSSAPLLDGLVSIWVDTAIAAKKYEEIIALSVARFCGCVVTESMPLLNTEHPSSDGERVFGMCQVVLLTKPPRLSREEWLETWLFSHTEITIECESNFSYCQNIVVRPLTYAAPHYDAIVVENYPPEAMDNDHVFYNANGSDEQLKANQERIFASGMRILDADKLDVLIASEYRWGSIG